MFDMGSFSNDLDYLGFTLSLLVDMDANDTAQAKIYQQAGATQSAINNDAEFNHFTGYLVC